MERTKREINAPTIIEFPVGQHLQRLQALHGVAPEPARTPTPAPNQPASHPANQSWGGTDGHGSRSSGGGHKKYSNARRKGRTTGFEPAELDKYAIPPTPTSFGSAGSGIGQTADVFGDRAQIGARGEELFLKAMVKAGLFDKFQYYWSVAMPDTTGHKHRRIDTDIDCILMAGRYVVLLDMKFYKGGDLIWRSTDRTISCFDGTTHKLVDSHTISKNMKMAKEVFKKLMRGKQVHAYVVFMVQESGAGQMDNVKWPGGIEAMYVDDLLVRHLTPLVKFVGTPKHRPDKIVIRLLK